MTGNPQGYQRRGVANGLASLLVAAWLCPPAVAGPVVAITTPPDGATISGQAWVNVAFRSDSRRAIRRVEVLVDGRLWQEYILPAPAVEGEKSFLLDFSPLSPGSHRLSARVVDAAGDVGSAEITIDCQGVVSPQNDRIPPTVTIYYPAQGALVSGRVVIRAEASDNVGVRHVMFFVDGKLHTIRMNAPPFTAEWDTTTTNDGPHVLEAKARDSSDNEGVAAPVTVIVQNRSQASSLGGTVSATGVQPTAPTPRSTGPVAPGVALSGVRAPEPASLSAGWSPSGARVPVVGTGESVGPVVIAPPTPGASQGYGGTPSTVAVAPPPVSVPEPMVAPYPGGQPEPRVTSDMPPLAEGPGPASSLGASVDGVASLPETRLVYARSVAPEVALAAPPPTTTPGLHPSELLAGAPVPATVGVPVGAVATPSTFLPTPEAGLQQGPEPTVEVGLVPAPEPMGPAAVSPALGEPLLDSSELEPAFPGRAALQDAPIEAVDPGPTLLTGVSSGELEPMLETPAAALPALMEQGRAVVPPTAPVGPSTEAPLPSGPLEAPVPDPEVPPKGAGLPAVEPAGSILGEGPLTSPLGLPAETLAPVSGAEAPQEPGGSVELEMEPPAAPSRLGQTVEAPVTQHVAALSQAFGEETPAHFESALQAPAAPPAQTPVVAGVEGPVKEVFALDSAAENEPVMVLATPTGVETVTMPVVAETSVSRSEVVDTLAPPESSEEIPKAEGKGSGLAWATPAAELGAQPEQTGERQQQRRAGLRRVSGGEVPAVDGFAAETETTAPVSALATGLRPLGLKDATALEGAQVVFEGRTLPPEAVPVVRGGVLMVSLKQMFEADGGALYWFPTERRGRAVTATADLTVQVGSRRALVNGESRELSAAPVLEAGRLLVPLDLVADVLGVSFLFDPQARKVIIQR